MTLPVMIITGQSGSGKSTAVRALEDHGYFCVDNMPASLVEPLVTIAEGNNAIDKLGLVMDARERTFVDRGPQLLERLRERCGPVRLIYLESREDVLLRRYSETRRRHPLDTGHGLKAAITAERERLAALRELADDTVDTSSLTPHTLRAKVIKQILGAMPGGDLSVALLSFGFKHGVPLDADMVLDVRFLPNPYFDLNLKERTGLDPQVRAFVLESEAGQHYVEHTRNYLGFLLPHFRAEGKRYLTVAIGCTGGQHRSVSIAHALAAHLQSAGVSVDLQHRDIKGEIT